MFPEDDPDLDEFKEGLLPTTREEIQITGGDGPRVRVKHRGDERWVIDGASQVGTIPFGHQPEWLHEELKRKLDDETFPTMIDGQGYYHEYQKRLAEELTEIYPGDLDAGDLKVYFCNSGSEAVERGCLKAAQLYGGGNTFVGFEDAFHGRTSLALSHTTSKAKYTEGFNFLARTLVMPFATHSGGRFSDDPAENARAAVDWVEKQIHQEGAGNVNSILLEPIQGEGGYNVPHPQFVRGLRRIATEHDIPLVLDEIQMAMRTGEWFAIEQFDVQPDMISIAKAFSGGIVPFGASLVREEFAVDESGHHSGTFGGNAKECFIALKSIERIREQNLLDNAEQMGARLRERLDELESSPIVHEVRGMGIAQAVEIRQDGEPAPDLRDAVLRRLFEDHGVLTESCGNDAYNAAIRVLLPLNVDEEVIDEVARGFERAVDEVEREHA